MEFSSCRVEVGERGDVIETTENGRPDLVWLSSKLGVVEKRFVEDATLEGESQISEGSRTPTPVMSMARLRNYGASALSDLWRWNVQTFATLTSVKASVTTVGCITL